MLRVPSSADQMQEMRVTPSFPLSSILPKKHNDIKSLKIAQFRPVSCPREGQQASNIRGAQRSNFCHDTILHTPRTDRRSIGQRTAAPPGNMSHCLWGRDDILHTPRPSQAAVRDLRVEAVPITASATQQYGSGHHDTHP